MGRLRAGLFGLGEMGQHHARVLAALDGVDLVAVGDPAGDVHDAAGGLPVVHDLEALLAHGLDYCVVVRPATEHEDLALALAEAGVHAMVEKPLALDSRTAGLLARAFSSRGLIGAVGYLERYNPALREARRRLADGGLGDLYQVATRRQGPFPTEVTDVGVVNDLGSHDLDLTAWVTRQPFVSVSARTAHRSGRVHEDLVAVVGQLADGTITSHLVNWLSPFKERVTVVTGTRGAYVADTLTADLTFFANGRVRQPRELVADFHGVTEGDVVRYAMAKPEPLRVEHEQFRDAVLGLDADVVTMTEATANVRVTEAVLESATTGRTVRLDEVAG
ncbi:Gfo/Idh/MocA family protein [Oryzobacter sp. R7]|uniref:Gfo/Idh/MocA family protein n=1 Tax=Oryzobacter faecalis TaxID=3388656 RepID=UPI00398CA529